MRLALTGGGTGGHIFPALEVGRLAAESGDDVRYFGSHRGQERKEATEAGFLFSATDASPIPKLISLHGLRAILSLLRSTRQVAKEFGLWRPDVLLSTGGYSAGPALRAARSLGVPIVLHEQNSVPGRSTTSMAPAAVKICIVFDETYNYLPKDKLIVTGMPVRQRLVDVAQLDEPKEGFTTLIAGGSQGARALNEVVIKAADSLIGDVIHITGPKLFQEAQDLSKSPNYKRVPFLDEHEMANALSSSSLAVVRAGSGTIAELALFRVPAIFVPLPTSFANHQLHNAREIERIGGGSILEQASLTPERLADEWRSWRQDESRRAQASAALGDWGKPNAASAVLEVVKGVAA